MSERFEVREFHRDTSLRGQDGAIYGIEHSYPLSREWMPVGAELESEAGR